MNKLAFFICIIGFVLAATSVWGVDASSGFSKRTAVLAFATQCNLLSQSQQSALLSGQYQARGALLRAGISSANINEMKDIAQTSVTDISCTNAEALAEIEVVKASHSAWLTLRTQSYPATFRSWETSRNDALLKRRWRVIQELTDTENARIRFGATILQGYPSLDLVIENRAQPRSVLLRFRDSAKLESPPSLFLRKLLKLPLEGVAGLAPPDSATRTFFTAERVPVEASLLSEETGVRGVRFGFGSKALEAFSRLDPREAVSVDLYWSAGLGKPDRHQRYYVEVGDFLAALLFAQAKDS